jgi:hypothetical protein
VTSIATPVDLIDFQSLTEKSPSALAFLGIDICIELMDGSRACGKAARKLRG